MKRAAICYPASPLEAGVGSALTGRRTSCERLSHLSCSNRDLGVGGRVRGLSPSPEAWAPATTPAPGRGWVGSPLPAARASPGDPVPAAPGGPAGSLTDPECPADRGQGASPLTLSFFAGRYGEGTTQARSPEGPTTALSLGLAPAFPLPTPPPQKLRWLGELAAPLSAQRAGWGVPVGSIFTQMNLLSKAFLGHRIG